MALGAISVLSRGAGTEAVRSAVLERFPEKLHAMNIRAFEAGAAAARALL